MIRNLKFEEFKNNMKGTTAKLLKEYSDFEGHDALSLDIYEDIEVHMWRIGYDHDKNGQDTDAEIDAYNLVYKEIERLYLNYLKNSRK